MKIFYGRTAFFLLILVFFLSGCAGPGERRQGEIYTLTGAARFDGHPLSSGIVRAAKDTPLGEAITARVRGDGSFEMALGPGVYYLTGTGSDSQSGGKLWAYWGGNPLNLFGEIADTLFLLFTPATSPPGIRDGTGIQGRVFKGGVPVEGAVVAVYLDPVGGFHGPPYGLSAPADAQGRYSLNITPGTYFLMAQKRRRTGWGYMGPLLKGDQTAYYAHNPVTLRQGEGMVVNLELAIVNRPRGEGSLSPGESIILEGVVTNEAGEPAPGVRACLYARSEMIGRPGFISSPSDEKGRYRLEVSKPGTFYLAGRSKLGAPPETGELMGYYPGSADHSVRINWGDHLTGMDIPVREVW